MHDSDASHDLRSLEDNCDGEFSSFFGRSQAGTGQVFADVVTARLGRRGLLKTGLLFGAATALGGVGAASQTSTAVAAPAAQEVSPISFTPIPLDTSDDITVAEGYVWEALLKWGDPIFAGAPSFDVHHQTPEVQAQQFGFNCDFVSFQSLPYGSGNPNEGLLWVNHEYTEGGMMFPTYDAKAPTKDQVDIELAAHGASIVHIRRNNGGDWQIILDSPWNRRITATTPMKLTGPAAGSDMLKTTEDPTGTSVLGMLNNCGGGWTPWGTVLTAEENFNQYFANRNGMDNSDPRKTFHQRYGLPNAVSERLWEKFYPRFDLAKEPNESHRHGWIVEVDPYDPASIPMKRTALGRMKHEAAAGTLSPSNRWVSYTGDDERFDYVYKFVSEGSYDPGNRRANLQLLDKGTLFVAKFNEDGSGEWLPLTFGQGPLTLSNGFASQADVLIRARQAGDALGATKMDRPEDIEVHPLNKHVFIACTFNDRRGVGTSPAADAINPLAPNLNGHVIELTETGDDHAATTFEWEIFLVAGDPEDPKSYFASYPKEDVSGFSAPDNLAFDTRGNMLIATDGQIRSDAFKMEATGPGKPSNDSVYMVPTEGPFRGQVRRLVNGVPGGEVASLVLGPDDRSLFLSIQHPGEGGTFAKSTSSWPDGPGRLARPSVIVVRRADGDVVGA